MRLALALGAAALAMTAVASAQQNDGHRIVIRHGGHIAADADGDGWMSRAESSAAADRLFDELDTNDDGRLNRDDRRAFEHDVIVRHGPGAAPPAPGSDDNCTHEESNEGGERRVTVICRSADGSSSSEDRQVIIRRSGGGEWQERDGDRIAPIPPVPPVPPVPPAPMFMFMLGDESEADTNGDGSLSREEFRTQHLRMFDAQDANGDGRIRAPVPPAPPAPPAPPEPPRRR